MKLSLIRTTVRLLSSDFRRVSTAASPTQNTLFISKYELYGQLSMVGSTGQRVTDVLHRLNTNGFKLDHADLVFCLKRLRQYRRYHHCLEILEWMEKGSADFSDHSLRLNLTYRLKGIDEAEKYFFNLPPEVKRPFLYGTLLNCYCSSKLPVKAFALFKKMDEMYDVSNSLVFDNLMGLYMKLNQPEKVHDLIEEMKQRNIPRSNVSYQILVQSYGQLKDLAGVEQVMQEVERHGFLRNDWKMYSSLTAAYINVGHLEKADSALRKLEEVVKRQSLFDRTAYLHLMSLYAKTGNKDSVFQAWGNLKSKFKDCHNKSYLVMLQALSNLDNIEGLKMILQEWELRHKSFDNRLPNVLIGAYLRHDMLEDAELLLKDTVYRSSEQKLWHPHISFMGYYLEKRDFDSAVKHMEVAYVNGWPPRSNQLAPFFEYFKEEKNYSGAEKLCDMLKNVQGLDSNAYLWLLQTYAAAGKEISGLRHRMEEDGVSIGSEHEDLLSKIDRS